MHLIQQKKIVESSDGESSELVFADSKDSIFIPKSYKDNFEEKNNKSKRSRLFK